MKELAIVSQVVVALGILNVWLVRSGKPTPWRGGGARSLQEEFSAYGLPLWFMTLVGLAKVSLAVLLLVGLWVDGVARPAAQGVAMFMLGAVAMHVKIGDPLRRSLPALSMLALTLLAAAA
jgi:uncharacterized membrane protein YphA (DoxX/SURF4 family)